MEAFLVSIDVVESLTGLDFFSDLDDDTEALLERTDTWDFWAGFDDAT